MLRSLSKSSRIPLVCAGSRSLASQTAPLSGLGILPRMGVRAAELCPRSQVYGLSGPVARYIGRNGPILHRFANEDVTLGAWLVGLEVTHVDERRFCCDSAERCMAQACPPPEPCAASHHHDHACTFPCSPFSG